MSTRSLLTPDHLARMAFVMAQDSGHALQGYVAARQLNGQVVVRLDFVDSSKDIIFIDPSDLRTSDDIRAYLVRHYPTFFAPTPAPVDDLPTLTPAEQRDAIRQDLVGKFQREDWHGVMDCAADLREHDAYHRGKAGK